MTKRYDLWPTARLFLLAARYVENSWNKQLSEWNLTHASIPVLYLTERAPSSQRELAIACGVTDQTMSRIVDRLIRLGFVERTVDPSDPRRRIISLTDHGHHTLATIGERDPLGDRLLNALSTSGHDPEEFRACLDTMLTEFGPDDQNTDR